ncbi:MAG: MFS transporter [Candidatus Hodarchaeota archaeon]
MTEINNTDEAWSKSKKIGFIDSLKIVFKSRNYVVILLTNYTGSLFLAAWIYLNLFFRDVGISYFELGLADSWAMMLGLFATMIGGYWADKHIPHRKYMATFNKFFIGIATLSIPFVTNFYGLLFVWTVFGFSQFCQSSIDPILFESLPPEQMGTGTSLFTLGGIFSIFGLFFVGFLIQDSFVSGLNIFWFLASVSSFIDFFIRIFFLEKTYPSIDVSVTVKNSFARDLIEQYILGFKVLLATIPLFLIVFLLDVASDINYRFAQNFYLNEDVGMGYTAINYTMIGASILGVIGGILAGRLLDRSENEAKVMFLVYFLLPFSVLVLFFSPTIPTWIDTSLFPGNEVWLVISSTAFVAVVIKSGNDAVWRTIAWGAVGRKLPREHTGKVMAILAMIISLMGVIISPVVGFIYQTEGGRPLLIGVLVLNLLILGLLLGHWLVKYFRKPTIQKTISSIGK